MAWYSGVLNVLVSSILGFFADVMIQLLTDKDVQKLAREAVEKALNMDLNDDGKIVDKSSEELLDRAKELGIRISKNEAESLAQDVLLKLKEEGIANLTEKDEK